MKTLLEEAREHVADARSALDDLVYAARDATLERPTFTREGNALAAWHATADILCSLNLLEKKLVEIEKGGRS